MGSASKIRIFSVIHTKIQEHQTELQSLTMKSIQKDEKQQEKMTTTTTSTISNTNIKATTATINLDLKHKSTRHPKKECMIKYQHQQNLQHQRQTVFATTTATTTAKSNCTKRKKKEKWFVNPSLKIKK